MSSTMIKEVLPKQGQLHDEDLPMMVLCKPKLLPLKSVTLEKLEKMQRDAEETVREQELAASKHPAKNFTFLERSKNVAPMFAERSLWTSLERTFVDSAKRSLNVRQ